MTIQDIIEVAEQQGWTAYAKEDKADYVSIEFAQLSPRDQDFNFCISGRKSDTYTLLEAIESFFKSFDVDHEAYLWIGEDGHGKRGAPYHIKDIVEDMEAVEEMIYQLLVALEHKE